MTFAAGMITGAAILTAGFLIGYYLIGPRR
jgi:hypothetical protein